MKKHQKLLSIAVLSASILSINLTSSFAEGNSFKDISDNFWGYKNIQWAADNKVAYGYPDGTFKPNQTVSQDEFLAMLIRAYQPSDFSPNTDSTKWSMPYLNYWTKLGWHLIMPNQAINNNVILSRGNVAQYLINATGKNYTIDDSIQSLLDTGISVGKTDKSLAGFKKDDLVTRAEAVAFIERLKQFNTTLHPNVLAPSIVYENTKNNFTLKLPKSWEGKYEAVDEINGVANIENIDFINKANKAYGGVLFTISVWSKDKWDKDGEEAAKHIQIAKIGEMGDKIISISTPSDVQYNLNDENLKVEFLSMWDDIKSIKTTLEFTN